MLSPVLVLWQGEVLIYRPDYKLSQLMRTLSTSRNTCLSFKPTYLGSLNEHRNHNEIKLVVSSQKCTCSDHPTFPWPAPLTSWPGSGSSSPSPSFPTLSATYSLFPTLSSPPCIATWSLSSKPDHTNIHCLPCGLVCPAPTPLNCLLKSLPYMVLVESWSRE